MFKKNVYCNKLLFYKFEYIDIHGGPKSETTAFECSDVCILT